MSFMKIVKTKLFVAVTLLSLGLLAGCTGDSNVSAVGTPNPNPLVPYGTIQGRLIDACTQAPIAGATIDIGVGKAVTAADGQYVIKNVPATYSADGSNVGSYDGSYSATIDLRTVNARIAKDDPKYPDFAYNELYVVFGNLNDAVGTSSGSGSGKGSSTNVNVSASTSNHDTPIVGIGSGDQDIVVGKLAASIKGYVFLPAKQGFAAAPAAGYFVQLIATKHHNNDDNNDNDNGGKAGSTNSTTGLDDNVVATAVTAADGSYTFIGVEAQRVFDVYVTNTDTTKLASAPPTSYGSTRTYGDCNGVVQYPDDITVSVPSAPSPCLIGTSPLQNENIHVNADGSSTVTVTFTFNKAVVGNSNNGALASSATNDPINTLALTSAGNPNSLFALVDVNLKGYKSSNVAHSLSWNATHTVLTVTIPNAAPAAIYSVDISRALGQSPCGTVMDSLQTVFTTNILGADNSCGATCTTFYTFGASIPAAPTVSLINTPYDYNSQITLSWLPTSQAKAYNVYCQSIQNWGTTQEVGAYNLIDSTTLAQYALSSFGANDLINSKLGIQDLTDTFIENYKIKITWQCKVTGVNADGVEGPASNVVTAADTVKPEVTGCSAGSTTLQVCFDEPMDKGVAQTIANYAFVNFSAHTPDGKVYSVPTITAANYTPSSHSIHTPPNGCVILTLNKGIDFGQLLKNPYLTVSGADVAGNAIQTDSTKFVFSGNACNAF